MASSQQGLNHVAALAENAIKAIVRQEMAEQTQAPQNENATLRSQLETQQASLNKLANHLFGAIKIRGFFEVRLAEGETLSRGERPEINAEVETTTIACRTLHNMLQLISDKAEGEFFKKIVEANPRTAKNMLRCICVDFSHHNSEQITTFHAANEAAWLEWVKQGVDSGSLELHVRVRYWITKRLNSANKWKADGWFAARSCDMTDDGDIQFF